MKTNVKDIKLVRKFEVAFTLINGIIIMNGTHAHARMHTPAAAG